MNRRTFVLTLVVLSCLAALLSVLDGLFGPIGFPIGLAAGMVAGGMVVDILRTAEDRQRRSTVDIVGAYFDSIETTLNERSDDDGKDT